MLPSVLLLLCRKLSSSPMKRRASSYHLGAHKAARCAWCFYGICCFSGRTAEHGNPRKGLHTPLCCTSGSQTQTRGNLYHRRQVWSRTKTWCCWANFLHNVPKDSNVIFLGCNWTRLKLVCNWRSFLYERKHLQATWIPDAFLSKLLRLKSVVSVLLLNIWNLIHPPSFKKEYGYLKKPKEYVWIL